MNKYNNNNYSRAPGSDPEKRAKNRSKYAANNSGGNNSPRYKYQKQSGYQYSHNRNSAPDNFQHNQYDKNQRYFYGNTSNRNKYSSPQQSKQSPNFAHKSVSPPSASKFSTSSQYANLTPYMLQTIMTTPPPKLPTQQPPLPLQQPPAKPPLPSPEQRCLPANAPTATVTAQNNQHKPIFTPNTTESSNYYGFPHNFYSNTYNADINPSTSSSVFKMIDGMNPYMGQNIMSTPPPNFQLQQPPLPQQQPPVQPPLPSPEILPLPPPPPIPVSITDAASTVASSRSLDRYKTNFGDDSGSKTIIKMKAKRKAMSTRYKLSKSWSERDAVLALKAEDANAKKLQKDFILIIHFPDPEISREIVKNYSPDIESVHFHLNFAPRCCLVHLKPNTDVEKTIDHLSKIPFGTGHLSVEIKQIPHRTHSTKLNEVDPFTLYVGNLPTTIACKTLKEHFPGAARIDIGFAQRMKYTRYAFIRYQTVHLAIEAYNRMLDAEIGGRTLTIRFRRLTAATEGNKDADTDNNVDIHDDIVVGSQTTVADCDSTENELAATGGGDEENNECLADKNRVSENTTKVLKDISNRVDKEVIEGDKNIDNPAVEETIDMEANLTETNESVSLPLISITENERNSQTNPNTLLLNVKPEPDIDPNDVVNRSNTIVPRCKVNELKQEQENLALYEELFERPQAQNESFEKSSTSDRISLASTTDDMDTISQLSSNSLGEFLQSCQRSKKQANNIVKDTEPPMKKTKVTIKSESVEIDNLANRENQQLSSKEAVGLACVKQELEERVENLNTSTESIHSSITNKSVPLSTPTPLNKILTEDNNNTNSNDDIVPPTALFFTSDYHSKWANAINNCDNEDFYDEFYETRVSSAATTSEANVKTEPWDNSINLQSTNKRNEKIQQFKPTIRDNSFSEHNTYKRCIETSNRNSTMSNTIENDDDLVPAHNLLGSYRPSNYIIKQETEYGDLYSTPFSKNTEPNSELNRGSPLNMRIQPNEQENISELSKSLEAESYDEDVVFVSANIPPASKEKKSDSSFYNNLFTPRLNDLVSLNYKPFAVPISSHEVSTTLLHRDHLDKLYDQLDADSDSDL